MPVSLNWCENANGPLQQRSALPSSLISTKSASYTGVRGRLVAEQELLLSASHDPLPDGSFAHDLGRGNAHILLQSQRMSGCVFPGTRVYQLPDAGDEYAREIFYAQLAICLCPTDDAHPLYVQDYVASRKVRFWACPVHGCDYEVSQRLEKTPDGWRMCGSFEAQKPIRIGGKIRLGSA